MPSGAWRRKEIYEPYLDVIYYVEAEMELERNNKAAAARIISKNVLIMQRTGI